MKKALRCGAGLAVVLLLAGAGRGWGLSDEETKRAETLTKQMDDSDPTRRAAAETELRRMGPEVISVLARAQVVNPEGLLRLRTILTDMSVDASRFDPTDADNLMVLAREEALSKRYLLAAKCYRRAEQIYDRLKDDADDRRDRPKEREYADLQAKAGERAKRAERIAKGEKFTGLNLGVVRVGVEHDTSDQDW